MGEPLKEWTVPKEGPVTCIVYGAGDSKPIVATTKETDEEALADAIRQTLELFRPGMN